MNQAVSGSGRPKLNRSLQNRLTLAGKPRNQEANRKRLVLALKDIERHGIKASKIRAKIESMAVEDIANNLAPAQKVLVRASKLRDGLVTGRLCELLGIDIRGLEYSEELRRAIVGRVYGLDGSMITSGTRADSPEEAAVASLESRAAAIESKIEVTKQKMQDVADSDAPDRAQLQKLIEEAVDLGAELKSLRADFKELSGRPPAEMPTAPTPSLDSAFSEALAIVRDAHINAELDELNWTREPQSDHERAVRDLMIRRTVLENEPKGPAAVCEALEYLHNLDEDEGEYVASDLRDAIDRWRTEWEDEFERQRKAESKRLLNAALGTQKLLDQARRDLNLPNERHKHE